MTYTILTCDHVSGFLKDFLNSQKSCGPFGPQQFRTGGLSSLALTRAGQRQATSMAASGCLKQTGWWPASSSAVRASGKSSSSFPSHYVDKPSSCPVLVPLLPTHAAIRASSPGQLHLHLRDRGRSGQWPEGERARESCCPCLTFVCMGILEMTNSCQQGALSWMLRNCTGFLVFLEAPTTKTNITVN